ncbi:hypothetical protein [Actinomadura sp. 3N407]|uniref:hypothetical protein n=1 Tax=Actinomadura sp. 3N407 TaxID=3457423 RepID=UPI003FCECD28
MTDFNILQDPDMGDEPPRDALHVSLPSGISFADGLGVVEAVLEADTSRHESIVVSIGDTPQAMTSRTFLAANFDMTGLMGPGAAQRQELPGQPAKYVPLHYSCPVCGAEQYRVRALAGLRCPNDCGPMVLDSQ